jgi:hypothetical protein
MRIMMYNKTRNWSSKSGIRTKTYRLGPESYKTLQSLVLAYGGKVWTRGGQLPKLREPHLSSHFGQEPQALAGLLFDII